MPFEYEYEVRRPAASYSNRSAPPVASLTDFSPPSLSGASICRLPLESSTEVIRPAVSQCATPSGLFSV